MKTVLVTGATGFIGRHVIRELVRQGYDVTATGRNSEQGRFLNAPFIPCDLYSGDVDFPRLFGTPDILMHLACPDTSNLKDPAHLERYLPRDKAFLHAMIENGVKHVFVSGTCFEYGLQTGALPETADPMPVTPYGEAKNALRLFLEGLKKNHDFILQWGRIFYLYGEGQNAKSLLPQLDRAIAAGEEVFHMSGGEQLRDYLSVEEVSRLIVALVGRPDAEGVFNCGSGKPISVRALVERRVAERGSSIRLNLGHYPYSDVEPMAFWADRTKMNILLGIKNTCDACDSAALREIYDLPLAPAFQHVLFPKAAEAQAARTVRVKLVACDSCGLVFNAAFDHTAMEYGEDYQNAQDHSPNFRSYLEEIADAVTKNQPPEARYVEIGCGKAFFFNILKERGLNIVGFDPAYEGSEPAIRKSYFSADTATHIQADTIIMRHTLEHIERPYAFLKQLQDFLPGNTRIFIEIPRFEWIVEHDAFWDIFHEHCNYFTEGFFQTAFASKTKITPTFDAQYMTVEARIGDLVSVLPPSAPPSFEGLFKRKIVRLAADVAACPRNIIWGAGAKGIAFANLLDPERRHIEAIVDINPRKQGLFIPLSAHPCVGPDSIDWSGLTSGDRLWIMNARYKKEILESLPPLRCTVVALGEET